MGFKARPSLRNTRVLQLLASVPAAAADAIGELLAAPAQTHPPGYLRCDLPVRVQLIETSRKTRRLVDAALAAVYFPAPQTLAVPMPDDLTQPQRAVAELLCYRDNVHIATWAMPRAGWCRRRWLGLEPGGVLERPVAFRDGQRSSVPLWRAMSVIASEPDSDGGHLELLAKQDLPMADWLDAMGDVALRAYNLRWKSLPMAPLRNLGDEGAEWAPVYADRLLYLFSGDVPFQYHQERAWWRSYPPESLWLAFLALVRAGITIEPRWDVLLPAARKPPRDLLIECVRALPEPRRAGAISSSCGRYVPDELADLILSLLPVFPSAALTDALLDRADHYEGKTRRRILSALEDMGKKEPQVQASVALYNSGATAYQQLHTAVFRQPTSVDELAAIQQKQLALASKLYDGNDVDLAERFERGADGHAVDGSFYGSLEFYQLASADKTPTYDVLLYMADSGTVFRAGGLEIVAEVIQGHLECDDGVVREMLRSALGLP